MSKNLGLYVEPGGVIALASDNLAHCETDSVSSIRALTKAVEHLYRIIGML